MTENEDRSYFRPGIGKAVSWDTVEYPVLPGGLKCFKFLNTESKNNIIYEIKP